MDATTVPDAATGVAGDALACKVDPYMPGSLDPWPAGIKNIQFRSSKDASMQPALFYAPASAGPHPLLVALHTWSSDYLQSTSVPYAKWSMDHDWVFVHPDFRGPSNHPEGAGSELAVADILDAVAYAKANANVDPGHIYLVGVSGGGFASLLMAGRAPNTWTAVSAWVPITDLQIWYADSVRLQQKYACDLIHALGGEPTTGTAAEAEAKKRSPMTYLASARDLPVSINAGIHDGHDGAAVPIAHSLRAFNLLADPADRLTDAQIAWFTDNATVPSELAAEHVDDPSYGDKKVLFRRRSHNVVVTIFAGGHEIVMDAALSWLTAH